MKRIFTFGFLLAVFSLLNTTNIYAQPANDNVCDALTITLDGPAVVVSNIDATAEMGEDALIPAAPTEAGPPGLCGPNGWCDQFILHSVWFKFIAPASTAVEIDVCGSDFDSQLALFEVTDCADFSTFRQLGAFDDLAGCGTGDGLSGRIRTECLTPGTEYYVLVDDWSANATAALDSGDVVITISTQQKVDPGIALTNTPVITNPLCPGGSEGSIDISLISGVLPITYNWSNGATTQDIADVPAGTYSVTVTDFCATSVVAAFDLEDPSEPEAITFGNFANGEVHPTHCGTGAYMGQISVPVATGVGPFQYEWSTGDTTGFVNGLADGTYTVTVTDNCDINSEVRVFHLGATAGLDVDLGTTCGATQIGVDNSGTGGERTRITYSDDQTMESGIACRGGGFIAENDTWRSWDLATDFGVTGEVNLDGVEVFITSAPNLDEAEGVPVKFTAYIASTPLLDDENLQLIGLDSFETVIPAIGAYTSYFVPLKGANLGPTDILAIKVSTTAGSGDGHRFDFAANETATTQTTYISSSACGLTTPITLASIGFAQQMVMNMFLSSGTGLTYAWDGPVDDATSATPMAMGTSAMTYNVTITDVTCGTTFVDAVDVACWTVGTEELVAESFAITPNPSNGVFQVVNEGATRKMNITVFDLQGKLVHSNQMNIGNGESKALNLDELAKGIYLAKFSNDNAVETYKLVIQ